MIVRTPIGAALSQRRPYFKRFHSKNAAIRKQRILRPYRINPAGTFVTDYSSSETDPTVPVT